MSKGKNYGKMISLRMNEDDLELLDDLVNQMGVDGRTEVIELLLEQRQTEEDLLLKRREKLNQKAIKLQELSKIDEELAKLDEDIRRQDDRKQLEQNKRNKALENAKGIMDEFFGSTEEIEMKLLQLTGNNPYIDRRALREHVYGKKPEN